MISSGLIVAERLPRKRSSVSKLSSDESALESDTSRLVDSRSFSEDGTRCLDVARPLEVMRNSNSRLKELRRVDGLLIETSEKEVEPSEPRDRVK